MPLFTVSMGPIAVETNNLMNQSDSGRVVPALLFWKIPGLLPQHRKVLLRLGFRERYNNQKKREINHTQ